MTQAQRRQRILKLALPIIGGMTSQNVLNLVDTAMVGVLGDTSLAGVGLGGFANFLLSAFVLGLGAGVQAMAARRVGQGDIHIAAVPLNGGLLLALGAAVPWSICLVALAPHYFPWLTSDPQVLAEGVPYLQARLVAMTALSMNYAFRGFWNAVDKSMLYMRTLIVMHASNIVLNWVFIFGNLGAPELGSLGAGIASSVSTFVGVGSYFLLGMRHARSSGFLRGIPDRRTIRTMVRLAVPAGAQQFFFAAGMTVFMGIVARVGTRELAAAKVLVDLILVGVLPGLGFGLAAASLVGQALGRGEPEDAKRWGYDVVRIAIATVFILALPAAIGPQWILRVFLHDPATLELARLPMRLVAIFLAFDVAGVVLMNALIGAGDTRRAMLVGTSLQWLLFLPVAYVVGPLFQLGLTAIFIANIVYRQLQSIVFLGIWKRGAWTQVKV